MRWRSAAVCHSFRDENRAGARKGTAARASAARQHSFMPKGGWQSTRTMSLAAFRAIQY